LTSVLFAAGSAWTTSFNGLDAERNTLTRIDPVTHSIVARIDLPGVPSWETGGGGMAYGDGSVWVTGSRRGPSGSAPEAVVARVDSGSDAVTAVIPLGGGLFGADVSVSRAGVWVALMGGGQGQVVRVDPSTNQVAARTVLTYGYVRRLVATDRGVVVQESVAFNNYEPRLETIEPASGELTPFPTRTWGRYLEIYRWRGQVWATEEAGFVRLDPKTGRATGHPFVAENSTGAVVASAPDGIWYARGAYLYRFDPVRRSLQRVMDLSDIGYIALAVGRGSGWFIGLRGAVTQVALR